MRKFKYTIIAVLSVFILAANIFAQTSVQNFGTGTGSQSSQTGSTTFLPNPTSGTTWARAGAVAPSAPIVLANTPNPLGTTGSYVRGVASSTGSVSKFSPMVGYAGSAEFYTSFKLLLGDASAGNTATSGSWTFYQGAGSMYSDASDFANAQVFSGLRFTFGTGGTTALTYRSGGAFINTGLTQTAFPQGAVYSVEIIGNNKLSGTITYSYNGSPRSVAVQKFDLYVNGTLIGDDLSEAGLAGGASINSNTFIGISSTSNVANVFVDDVITYNSVPTTIGNAPTPNLTVNDVSLNEGNAGTTSFTFTVSLSGPAPAGGITFDIATADGTATAPSDYASKVLTGQTIPAGSSTYSFTVLVNGDTEFESNETFFVNVTNVTGATVTDGQGQGTIVNDDVQPSLSINDVSLNEGNAGTTNFSFTVGLSGPAPAGGVTFDIATADETANAPSDYVSRALTGQTIPAGSSSYMFNVAVNGDTVIEPNETFFVNVTNVTGATVADGQGQGTIPNDDVDTTAPVISYAPLPAKASDSSSTLVVTVTDDVAVQNVSVNYAIGTGTLQTASCALASGSTYNCIIDETGGSNQTISYYVSATDTSGNTTRFPATSNDGYAIGSANIQGGTYDVLNVLSGSLAGNVVINTNFSYMGIINSNGGSLRIGCNATLDAGNVNKFINATITKDFCSPQTFTYPFGNAPVPAANQIGISSFYAPLTVNVTSVVNPSNLTASMIDDRMPGADPANSISRHWSLTESGSITADLTFQYDASDVNGNESLFKVIKNENGTTTSFENSTVDTVNHRATVSGISDFSLWSVGVLSPLAANASISGCVLTADGLGIRNASLTISGGNLSEPRRVLTGSFGYYQFDDLEVGQTYIITINSKRYVFKNSVVVVSLQDNISDYNFQADPQ